MTKTDTKLQQKSHLRIWTLSSQDSSTRPFSQVPSIAPITSNSQSMSWTKQLSNGKQTGMEVVGTLQGQRTTFSMWPSGWVTQSRQVFATASTLASRDTHSSWLRMRSLTGSLIGSLLGFRTYLEMLLLSMLFTTKSRKPPIQMTRKNLSSGMESWQTLSLTSNLSQLTSSNLSQTQLHHGGRTKTISLPSSQLLNGKNRKWTAGILKSIQWCRDGVKMRMPSQQDSWISHLALIHQTHPSVFQTSQKLWQ